MRHQSGVSLWSVLVFAVLFCLLAVSVIKLTPDLLEYLIIQRDIRASVQETAAKGGNSADFMSAFETRVKADAKKIGDDVKDAFDK